MAKRSIGVTIGGVLLALQSAAFLLVLLFVIVFIERASHSKTEMLPALITGAGIYGGCFGLSAASAYGILRLRRWARTLVLFASWLGGLLGACLLTTVLVSPLLDAPLTGMEQQRLTAIGVFCLISSVWWLGLLTRPSVKQQFGLVVPTQKAAVAYGRPLSVTIIAILLWVASLGMFSVWRAPVARSWLLGMPVPLWLFRAVALLMMALGVWLGIGLWRLRRWAWRGMMAYLGYCAVSMLLSLRMPMPSASELFQEAALTGRQLAAVDHLLATVRPISVGLGLVWLGVQFTFLLVKRHHFSDRLKGGGSMLRGGIACLAMSVAVALPTLSDAKDHTMDLSLPEAIPHGRMEQAGVSVEVEILDREHTMDIFDVDLIKKSVQPVMIKIHNGSTQTYRFTKADVDAHYIPAAAAAKRAYENPIRIGGRLVGRAVRTVPRWLLNSRREIEREQATDQPLFNREMQAGFVQGEIPDADVVPDGTLEGFLYLRPLEPGAHVRVRLLNTGTQEPLVFERATNGKHKQQEGA